MISSVLANFLDIGTMQSGGNAQSDNLKEMFLQSIQHIGKYVSSVLSKEAHLIYVMNFGEPDVRLDMKVTGISKKDTETLSKVISGLGNSKFLTPDDNIEAYVRKEVGLPDMEDDDESIEQRQRNRSQDKTLIEDIEQEDEEEDKKKLKIQR